MGRAMKPTFQIQFILQFDLDLGSAVIGMCEEEMYNVIHCKIKQSIRSIK